MSVLMRPTLIRQANVKLLRYLGGTQNLEYRKLVHTEVSNVLDRIDIYPKWGPLRFDDDSVFEVAEKLKLRASDQDNMLLDVEGYKKDLPCDPPELETCRYDLMLAGFTEKGYLDEALIILRRKLLAEHMVWNKDTYIAIFGLCARLEDFNLGRQVHNKMLKSDTLKSVDDESVHVFNALMKMYGKCKEILSARKVFDMCRPLRKVCTWNTVFAAYSESLEFDMPLKGFIKMRREDDVCPNESTFCILLNASAELHDVRVGKMLHVVTFKTGFEGCKKLEDTLINMYSRTGDIKAAEKVFLRMTSYYYTHDTRTWNAMICGYSLHSYGNKALALFQAMLELGQDDPDGETFVGVLNACGHLGHVEEGLHYLDEVMKQKGVEPGLEHYLCIIKMLIKAGLLNKALSFIVSTPSNWDAFAWATFLRGCQGRGNYDLGIRAAELIPDDVATKVSKWFGVTQIHEVLKIIAKKEEDGESWLQIHIETRGFYSLRKRKRGYAYTHRAMTFFLTWIYKYIELYYVEHVHAVYDRVPVGYDTSYHSEAIALASAIYTRPIKPSVCIIKTTGEMCRECHNLFILTSTVLPSRFITVRDAKQFHNFSKGKCSCGVHL